MKSRKTTNTQNRQEKKVNQKGGRVTEKKN